MYLYWPGLNLLDQCSTSELYLQSFRSTVECSGISVFLQCQIRNNSALCLGMLLFFSDEHLFFIVIIVLGLHSIALFLFFSNSVWQSISVQHLITWSSTSLYQKHVEIWKIFNSSFRNFKMPPSYHIPKSVLLVDGGVNLCLSGSI